MCETKPSYLIFRRVLTTLWLNSSFISSRLWSDWNDRMVPFSLWMNPCCLPCSYCTNISFYLVLKAKRIPAHNHPVIERLLTYRNVSPRCADAANVDHSYLSCQVQSEFEKQVVTGIKKGANDGLINVGEIPMTLYLWHESPSSVTVSGFYSRTFHCFNTIVCAAHPQ